MRALSIACALVIAATVGGCSSKARHAAPAPSTTRSQISAPPLAAARATALASQLADGTDDGVRAAVAMPSGQPLDPKAAAQLEQLGPITFDLTTFAYLDPVTAQIRGHIARPPTGTSPDWTFTLVYQPPDWKIADGKPQ